jgi:hypothetical protein
LRLNLFRFWLLYSYCERRGAYFHDNDAI